MRTPEGFEALPDQYLTADLEGIGGTLKAWNEDFIVEEIPAYEPCGAGEHLYLFIEKNGRPTLEVLNEISRHFRVPMKSVGYAGMKDKYAITRQYISVHTFDESPAESLDLPGVRVLRAARHRNRLRVGHLKGNRFVIRIRDVDPSHADRAERILQHLAANGSPNYLGEQRFGYRTTNHLIGRAYILQDWKLMCDILLGRPIDPSDGNFEARQAYERGDYQASVRAWSDSLPFERQVAKSLANGADFEQAIMRTPNTQRRFFITAFQSAIFNNVLDDRIRRGWFQQFFEGDVAWKHVNGAMFRVNAEEMADPETEARRARLEISPTGPMWGYDMLSARGEIVDIEQSFLDRTDVEMQHFVTPPHEVRGTRRPLRIPVIDPAIEAGQDERGPYIETTFQLPRGSFATTILREIMKTEDRDYPWGSHRDERAKSSTSTEAEQTAEP